MSKPKNNHKANSGIARMVAHSASGAAGIHADQKTRRLNPAGKTNRVGSRSSVKRAVLKDWQ